jgi:DNA (cytosine-5)-methyltransferase 1
MSLFANVGVAEALLNEIGVEVVLANEIDPKRVQFYKHLYPKTKVIQGDIKAKDIFEELILRAKELEIDFLMATPPCQGMSTAGKKDKEDKRNELVIYAIEMIKKVKPKYVLLENVPQQLKTKIVIDNEVHLIPDYIKKELEKEYIFNANPVINSMHYGVPQSRERSIFLLTRKDMPKKWEAPEKENTVKTLFDAIGDLPELDPSINDIPYDEHISYFPKYEIKKKRAEQISKWHTPPKHVFRQVLAMEKTPTGKSAFENENPLHRPLKKDGEPVKGFKNTYKRQSWDRPGYTITMYNRTIGSQENVHPGRKRVVNGEVYYTDSRVLTVFEIMRVMSLPDDWDIPNWVSEHFVRQVIGEGIPPLLVKKLFLNLIND